MILCCPDDVPAGVVQAFRLLTMMRASVGSDEENGDKPSMWRAAKRVTDYVDDPVRVVRSRGGLFISVAALMASALIVAGCGVEGQDLPSTVSTDSTAPTAATIVSGVSTEDIDATPSGSPERTVLEWWRALQARDVAGVQDAYTEKVRKDLPDGFKFSVVSYLAPLANTATITIDSVDQNGGGKAGGDKSGDKQKSGSAESDKATIYATLDSNAPRMAGSLAVPLERESGEWKIS